MCLFLVGITLRMAPIIDDMGKFYSGVYGKTRAISLARELSAASLKLSVAINSLWIELRESEWERDSARDFSAFPRERWKCLLSSPGTTCCGAVPEWSNCCLCFGRMHFPLLGARERDESELLREKLPWKWGENEWNFRGSPECLWVGWKIISNEMFTQLAADLLQGQVEFSWLMEGFFFHVRTFYVTRVVLGIWVQPVLLRFSTDIFDKTEILKFVIQFRKSFLLLFWICNVTLA